MGPGQSYPGSVQIADGKVYACTGEATVSPIVGMGSSEYSCFNASTGQVIWQVPKEFEAGPSDYACIAYGNFYDVNQELSNGTTVDSNVAGIGLQHNNLSLYVTQVNLKIGMSMDKIHHTQQSAMALSTNLTLTWKFHTNGAVSSSQQLLQATST